MTREQKADGGIEIHEIAGNGQEIIIDNLAECFAVLARLVGRP